jgi:hypothetical protein
MKRSELRPDPEQVRAWQQRSRETAIERAYGREGMQSISARQANPEEYARANGISGSSIGWHGNRPKGRRRRTPRDRFVPRDWTRRVFELHGAVCVVTGQRAQQAHHGLPVQLLIREGLAEFAGDPRGGVPVTKRVHERHETAHERILLSCLPASVFELAAELGLDWYLEDERVYPRIPPAWRGRL